jgi:hypothetical protein
MSRIRWFALLVVASLATAAACDRDRGEGGAGVPDTLDIEVPDEVGDRFEEGARRLGGKVGEALQETGEAIEGAGERIEEEAGEPVTNDTTDM